MLKKLSSVLFLFVLSAIGMSPFVKAGSCFVAGVSLSPKSYQPADFTDFFDKAKQAGNVVSWAGDWDALGAADEPPEVIAELASTYDYIPLIEAQFFSQSTGQLLRPLNETVKLRYKNGAIHFAGKYKPEYLAFGIEVNILYTESPTDFEDFVELYAEIYDAVKEVSPATSVFTIFQLEKLKGLEGGLYGGQNDPTQAAWFLLDRFSKSDLIGFTTYPSLVFKNPAEIPSDYYSEISIHTQKPVAFTEIGWHTAPTPVGWEGSEEKQNDFVRLFSNYTETLNKEIVIWSFLYDQNVTTPFNSMGFFGADGNPKLAWNSWTQLIIPEFLSFHIIPLFLIVTLLAVTIHKRNARSQTTL